MNGYFGQFVNSRFYISKNRLRSSANTKDRPAHLISGRVGMLKKATKFCAITSPFMGRNCQSLTASAYASNGRALLSAVQLETVLVSECGPPKNSFGTESDFSLCHSFALVGLAAERLRISPECQLTIFGKTLNMINVRYWNDR